MKQVQEYGRIIVGALTDNELIRYNRFPTIQVEERMKLYSKLENVSSVIEQKSINYDDVIKSIKPDFVVHGDNWQEGPEKAIRTHLLQLLKEYGGELIEIPYTRTPEVSQAEKQMVEKLSMPEFRRNRLGQLLQMRPIVKAIEVHNGITGLIAEKTVVEHDGKLDQFDAMWISSLCDSIAKGKPDIELVDMTSRFSTIEDVTEVTTKPIIFDGDTGGLTEHFVYTVRSLERMGVSAVIIEDKTGLKKNSLFGNEAKQT